MLKSKFRVLSDAEKWRFWKIQHLWVRICSKFDEPDHPFGQWSARLTRVGEATSSGPCLLFLEFLVEEAPWQQIQPGMVLRCFYATRHLADLIVEPELSGVELSGHAG